MILPSRMRRKSLERGTGTPRDPSSQAMCTPDTSDTESPTESVQQSSILPSFWERCADWGASYIHISPVVKICYYTISLIICSMVQESADLPHFQILTGKYSILNQVFVKQGWGFTLAAYVSYQLVSTTLHVRSWSTNLKRLAVGVIITTFFFFIWCQVIFPGIEYLTSSCTIRNILVNLGKRECVKRKGHVYHSFDISGHSYLLTYCVLVLMEESKGVWYFLQVGQYLREAPGGSGGTDIVRCMTNDEPPRSGWNRPEWTKPNEEETNYLRRFYPLVSPFVVLSFTFMVFLALLWDFMLIITTIYYHTVTEKVLGSALAVAMWHLIYGRLFPVMGRWKFFTVEHPKGEP